MLVGHNLELVFSKEFEKIVVWVQENHSVTDQTTSCWGLDWRELFYRWVDPLEWSPRD